MAQEVIIYSDLNPIDPIKTPMATNIQAIFNSIYTILNTKKGERLFLPTFGCDLEEILFEIIDEETSLLIYQRIIEAIETWEKRVTLDYGRSKVVPDYDANAYYITLVFNINLLEAQSFTFEGSIKVL
jgi:phage baseplate assembly protein W